MMNDEELKERLTDEQYQVTQQKGTERPFTGRYVDHKEDGTYACVCCGTSLFSSDHKYDSGSGWPSFWLPLAEDNIRTVRDDSLGMIRREVLCKHSVIEHNPRQLTKSVVVGFARQPDQQRMFDVDLQYRLRFRQGLPGRLEHLSQLRSQILFTGHDAGR